jgi:hypothetical protein
MSSRHRIPVLVGAVCTAVLLAGCSSSGTVGGNNAAQGTSGGTSGGTGGATGGAASDRGCSEALLAIQNAEKAQNSTNPQAALQALTTSIGQLRDAAQATQVSGGKDAMNKVADDLQAIETQAQSGQQPSTSQALADGQAVVTLCGA